MLGRSLAESLESAILEEAKETCGRNNDGEDGRVKCFSDEGSRISMMVLVAAGLIALTIARSLPQRPPIPVFDHAGIFQHERQSC